MLCFENDLECSYNIISSAQESIGISIPVLCRHYTNRFYPEKMVIYQNESIITWQEGT